jgi:excisionase family DNA binding protein
MEEKSGRACYSVEEGAEKLGVNIKTAYEGIKAKQIPSIRIGRRILIPKGPFDKMLNEAAQ